MQIYKPKDIFFDGKVNIIWQDKTTTVLEYYFLRLNCRCASCINELTGENVIDKTGIPRNIYPVTSEYIGNYALRITWSDKHSTGIYTFRFLKTLSEENFSNKK